MAPNRTHSLDRATRQLRLRRWGLLLFVVLLVASVMLSLTTGTQAISLATTWDAIWQFDPADTNHLLVHHLRVPRTLLGILVGCALGVAGAIMQALTRNPVADPGILGINAGAAAAITAAIAFFGVTNPASYMVAGLLGAALAGLAVYQLGGIGRGNNPVRLVLAGAALTVVLLSFVQIVLINSEEVIFDQYRHWFVGSLQGRGYSVLLPVLVLIGAGLAVAFSLARDLDAAALGHDLTKALGANPTRTLSLSAVAVIALAGAATAAAGPIAFIGLTAPHIARFLAGPNHRWVLPYSMLISAVLVVGADTLGRVIAPPGEVGVGIMVALMGGPFFIALVRSRRLAQL